MKLYNYFRSSASYRVRIALNLKGLAYDYVSVHLTREGGEQFAAGYRGMAPEALVPVLEDGTVTVHQSLAIIEYLDEIYPSPPLLPSDAAARAAVRAMAMDIACDLHPLGNLRVLKHLAGTYGLKKEDTDAWYRHWVGLGFGALENRLASSPARGRFCHGDAPSMADIALVPQVFNARRFGTDMKLYPVISAIADRCDELDAFAEAAPARQVDAE
ncbi:maleylacetoacetate isomerase [Rhodanobacter sp. Si-c]|uniref:Maleylacetoacetate isomerase n=1 Tax=Rhodanobacter lycopersici TaxID=3162487 RepID=A0ABV3QI60_9GAMM